MQPRAQEDSGRMELRLIPLDDPVVSNCAITTTHATELHELHNSPLYLRDHENTITRKPVSVSILTVHHVVSEIDL